MSHCFFCIPCYDYWAVVTGRLSNTVTVTQRGIFPALVSINQWLMVSIANHQPSSQVHQLTAQVNLTTSHQCQFVEIVCQHHQSHQPPVIEIGKGDLQNLRLEYTPKKSNLILLGVLSKVGLCLVLKVTITKKDQVFFSCWWLWWLADFFLMIMMIDRPGEMSNDVSQVLSLPLPLSQHLFTVSWLGFILEESNCYWQHLPNPLKKWGMAELL